MKKTAQILLVLILSSCYSIVSFAQDRAYDGVPEEIVVVGRQPGPPMWKVSNGDNVLWIFPLISYVPKDMIWESDKVEKVIAGSQEYIGMPGANASVSKLILLNPINLIRGYRLVKRISRNPDKAKLVEVVPAELYARFSALKEVYFPRDKGIEKTRPYMAGEQMTSIIRQESGLVNSGSISRKIRDLLKKNEDVKHTSVMVEMSLETKYSALAKRIEDFMASLSQEQELACFESQIELMENDIDGAKSRANDWARGFVDEFKYTSFPESEDGACGMMMMNSSENETLEEITAEGERRWMDAVESALNNNQSTFAVLRISELIKEGGYIDRLKAKGYQINDPFLN